MNRLRKTFIVLSAAAAIALVISVAGPRTARAAAAILVQMTNTTANPAVTQGIATMNAQIVEFHDPDEYLKLASVPDVGHCLCLSIRPLFDFTATNNATLPNYTAHVHGYLTSN